MGMRLELVAVPVTDVDRAKEFYVDKVGFNADHDHPVSEVEDFPWGSFVYFSDPNGNTWALQQIPKEFATSS